MTYRIAKTFTFEAAHHLPSLPPSHKCSRPHGHSYTVEIVLSGEELDEHGMVLDYGVLSATIGKQIDRDFDHSDLNDLIVEPTTAENIARIIYDLTISRLLDVHPDPTYRIECVRVSETAKTWAEYRP